MGENRAGRRRQKAVALYHDMRVEEDFDAAARRLFEIVRQAERSRPGAPRHLFLDVQGHRNDDGGFDWDAYEFMTGFVVGFLGPFLTEIHTPLLSGRRGERQRNDIPDSLVVQPAADPDPTSFDVETLAIAPREQVPVVRRSRPSLRAIAAYLGLDGDPSCQICWDVPVERAHVVPASLGGSNDVRNFALLCRRHHRAAPDVADAAAFWRWVDYAADHAGHERMNRLDPALAERLHDALRAAPPAPSPTPARFHDAVAEELVTIWGWATDDVAVAPPWAILAEADHVLNAATSRHFGVPAKPSTYAWALTVAKDRLARVEAGLR